MTLENKLQSLDFLTRVVCACATSQQRLSSPSKTSLLKKHGVWLLVFLKQLVTNIFVQPMYRRVDRVQCLAARKHVSSASTDSLCKSLGLSLLALYRPLAK